MKLGQLDEESPRRLILLISPSILHYRKPERFRPFRLSVYQAFNVSRSQACLMIRCDWIWLIHRLGGGAYDDLIYGYGGNDKLYGRAGNDQIWGGLNDDQIWGEAGSDTLRGEDGLDTIYSGDGSDFIYSGNGNDMLLGEGGNDSVYGGAGLDTIYGGLGVKTQWITLQRCRLCLRLRT
jgi:hypothetical protein